MNTSDQPAEEVELVQRDGRFFVIVRERGETNEHGPLDQEDAIELYKHEDARVRGQARH